MNIKNLFFVFLTLLWMGCNNSPNKTDEHAEQVKMKYTAYSQDFELFAEADPFVVGKSSNVLSHFSHLPDFKALEKGRMTIIVSVGNKEDSSTLEKPTRKGIYSFDITPTTQGMGQMSFLIKTENGNFKLIVPNIMVFANENQAKEAAGKLEPSRTNTVSFTKEQSWKIDFASETPKMEPFGQVIKTTAQVQSAQGDEMMISARTNGIIRFIGESVLEGKMVSTGQSLFGISGNGMAENNSNTRFVEAQSNYEKANANYSRQKELAKDKIVSEKDLLSAKNEFENAKAIFENLSSNFNASGQTISSPLNGFIKQVFVQNGQYVEAGQTIATISQNKTLVLLADVQQKYSPILGLINTANIRTIQDNKTYSLEQLNGKILSYGRNANIDNYLIPVSLQIDNKGSFISGGFVELYIKTITNKSALTIPNYALVEEQGSFFVFVQVNPELFEKKEVKTGSTDGFRTEIVKGITLSDRIVTKGAILVKLAQSSGALDAHSGHVH